MLRSSAAGLVLLVALALGACGGDHADGRYDRDGVALSYPGTWTTDRSDDAKGLVLSVHGPPRRDRTYTRVTLVRQPARFPTLDAFARSVKDDRSLTLRTRAPVELTAVRLAGGTPARRIVSRVRYRLRRGRTVPFVLRETVALSRGRQYRLTVFAADGDAGTPAVRRIERSLEVPRG